MQVYGNNAQTVGAGMMPCKRAMSFEIAFFGHSLSPAGFSPMRNQIPPFWGLTLVTSFAVMARGRK
jgi:hypothetical protein